MKRIVVCLKQAVDVSQLKVDPATRQPLVASAPRKMSDFDKNALEEAIRIKEKNPDSEICTVTVTSEDVKPVLREALAMGADKAFAVSDPSFKDLDTSGTAKLLASAIRKIGEYSLVLCGDTSLDSFSGVVAGRLGELLGVPAITSTRQVMVEAEGVLAERSLEDMTETVRAKFPLLVSVTREINQPRIPSLMMIMKASKKEIVTWTLHELGFVKDALAPKIIVTEVIAPKTERKKVKITGENAEEIADKLAKALIQEGVVGR